MKSAVQLTLWQACSVAYQMERSGIFDPCYKLRPCIPRKMGTAFMGQELFFLAFFQGRREEKGPQGGCDPRLGKD